MLKQLLSNLRGNRGHGGRAPDALPYQPDPVDPPGDTAEPGRAALQDWLKWDRLPPFNAEDLYADPMRAQAAQLLAMSADQQRVESLLRGLLARPEPHPADYLLYAETLLRQGNHDGTQALLREVEAFPPALRARAACINGQLEFHRGDFVATRRWIDIALAFAPHSAAVQVLNGMLLDAEGRLDEAVVQFRGMLATRPDDYTARIRLGIALHGQGRIAEGLHEQVTADALIHAASGSAEIPLWDGRPLQRETILITSNAGIGDILQNMRYARRLRLQAPEARLVLWTRAEVASVAPLTGWFDEVSSDPTLDSSRFDWQISLVSLALLHFLDEKRPDLSQAYIRSKPERLEAMRLALANCLHTPQAGSRSLRVGLRWSGDASSIDSRRNVPPERLHPLFQLPGICWVALLERGNEQRAWVASGATPMVDVSEHLGSLADTAALIENLDLVISVDTSVAHLAGALGVRTWLLCRPESEPRWGAGEQSSLYASVRTFRHPGKLDWERVLGDVADALALFTKQRD